MAEKDKTDNMQHINSENSQNKEANISRLVGRFLRGENWKKLVKEESDQPGKDQQK